MMHTVTKTFDLDNASVDQRQFSSGYYIANKVVINMGETLVFPKACVTSIPIWFAYKCVQNNDLSGNNTHMYNIYSTRGSRDALL